jgi:hypothetical protein
MRDEKCADGRHVWKSIGMFVKGDALCECGYVTAECAGYTTESGWVFF